MIDDDDSVQEVKLPFGQTEMIITSNLTTLNIDGENSSLDGENLDKPADSPLGNRDIYEVVQQENNRKALDDQKYL